MCTSISVMHSALRSSVTPVQRIITTQKGIALDYDGLAGDTQAHSKELYMWGQSEEADIRDGASVDTT